MTGEGRERPDGLVQAVTPAETLDLRGLGAGTPLLVTLRNALDRLPPGRLLEVQISPDGPKHDITAWQRLAGHDLVSEVDGDDHLKLIIRKQTPTRDQAADWGMRLPSREGTRDLRDWLVGRFGEVPDEAPTYYGFMPRGAVLEPGSPSYPYSLNRRSQVWADNLQDLYEQAKSQQWDATRDIPWDELKPLPDALERAVCQLMTFLAENEYAALYIPAKFIPRINAQFVEPVLFLASVVNDEARHIEAFTKRALANGGGLQYSSALSQRSLHSLLVQEDYFRSSFLLHVLGEGTFLDLLDFIERHAPDPATREVVRRSRLDEGRHVAYGIAHVREVLAAQPAAAEELVAAAEERSLVLQATSGANPMVTEALAVLAAGGAAPSGLERGFAAVEELFRGMHRYRVRRLLQVGLDVATAEKISQLHTPNFM